MAGSIKMSIMTHKATFRRIIFSLALLLMVLFMTSCTLIVMNLLGWPGKAGRNSKGQKLSRR